MIVGILKLLIRKLTIQMTMDIIIPMRITKMDIIIVSIMIIVAMITAKIVIFIMKQSRINNNTDSDI